MTRTRWLWLPAEDGGIAAADPLDLPADIPFDIPFDIPAVGPADLSSASLPFARTAPALRAVNAG